MIDPLLSLIFIILLFTLFSIGGVLKILSFSEFHGIVHNYRLLPEQFDKVAAIAVISLEITAALLITSHTYRYIGISIAALLLTVFTLAILINILRGNTLIDCGCFRRTFRQYLTFWLVLRNLVLLTFTLLLFLPTIDREITAFDRYQAFFAALVLYLIYIATNLVFITKPPTYEENFYRHDNDPIIINQNGGNTK